jgi:tetratricopeptide (TPR) repeat protein
MPLVNSTRLSQSRTGHATRSIPGGAYSWEERLCQEVLAWIPAHSHWEATFTYRLGMLAQDQGNYEEARRQYQRSLKIDEELGNRANMATSYHELGILAQRQGDYEEAHRQYQRSFKLFEELGHRVGMASSYGQLGLLLTEIGKVEEAVGYTLASLVFYLQVGAPEANVNLSWLARQQEQLGETQFRTVVHRHLGEQDTENLLQVLKEQEGEK